MTAEYDQYGAWASQTLPDPVRHGLVPPTVGISNYCDNDWL